MTGLAYKHPKREDEEHGNVGAQLPTAVTRAHICEGFGYSRVIYGGAQNDLARGPDFINFEFSGENIWPTKRRTP